jgi:hypothetical protein
MEDVLNGAVPHPALPMIYNSFVHRDLIDNLAQLPQLGPFFDNVRAIIRPKSLPCLARSCPGPM